MFDRTVKGQHEHCASKMQQPDVGLNKPEDEYHQPHQFESSDIPLQTNPTPQRT